MGNTVPYHYMMMAAGYYLRSSETVTAQNIQDMIALDENFRMRPSLPECKAALKLLEMSFFLKPKIVDKDGNQVGEEFIRA